MQPASGAEVYLRFIQGTDQGNYAPLRTEGWNALELLVKDPDALANKLADSPFNIVGQPAFLTEKQNVRAFQAVGPNKELLYFTRIIDPTKSEFDLGSAQSYVDRVFIMVLGGKDMQAMTRFYTETFKQVIAGPYPYRVRVLSRAYGKPGDTLYPLSIAVLADQFLLEIDEYPASVQPRDTAAGNLPPGIAMVTVAVDNLNDIDAAFLAPPRRIQAEPYGGRRVAVVRGAAGELLELVETL
jgi:hypothetical protein